MRKITLPLWNTYYFFTTYANIDNFDPNKDFVTERENNLDKWIISELNKLIKDVTNAMDNYTLMQASSYIFDFIESLTNWYIRRSRRRFWKSENDQDKIQAYSTLYEVLVKLTQVLAPFMPFVTDYIYQDLTKEESVHLSDWPEWDENLIDEELNKYMQLTKNIVSLGLSWRARNKIRVRQPLAWVKITKKLDNYYNDIIKEELNVKDVIVSTDLAKEIAKPEGRKIGPKYGKDVQLIIKNAKE
jgi:isoleucyl-tRNA synthetase